MTDLHNNLCQALRQKERDCNFNHQSFDETNNTIGLLMRGGGRVETMCSAMEQMGVTVCEYTEEGFIIFK